MLVLSRKLGEAIRIDSDVTVHVLEIRRGRVRLGIEAPRSRRVVRAEVELPQTMQAPGADEDDRPKALRLRRSPPGRASNCCARPSPPGRV